MEENKYEIYKAIMLKMMHIKKLHRSIFEKRISSLGIHHSQHQLLMYIAKEKEISSQKKIADKFGITPAAVARTLKTLEIEGFIERSNIEGDSRFNRIIITQKGKEIVNKTNMTFKEIDSSIFANFTENELNSLNLYLDSLNNNLIIINENHEKGISNEKK